MILNDAEDIRLGAAQVDRVYLGAAQVWPSGPTPVVAPIAWDFFTRPTLAAAMGTAPSGQAWTPLAGSWRVHNNEVQQTPAAQGALMVLDAGVSDCVIRLEMSISGDAGLCFRFLDASNGWVWSNVAGRLFKKVSGAYSQVGVDAGPGYHGDYLEIILDGPSIEVWRNGSLAVATSDSHAQTATRHGLYGWNSAAWRGDNFEVWPLPAIVEQVASLDDSLIRLGPAHLIDSNPVATFQSGSWDTTRLREPGNALYDPVTDQWIVVYSGATGSTVHVGGALSPDGLTWTPMSNPITGSVMAEDPYIAKSIDGTVWRDSSGRALMFVEEKPSLSGQRGVELWRSAPDLLTGWTYVDRVLDRAASGWDSEDRTSPVVFHDGDQLMMLYEGRSGSQAGRIGRAVSHDEGETWTVDALPIISQGGSGTWNAHSIVPDDIIKIGATWVMLTHGAWTSGSGPEVWRVGRYSTSDDPADWDDASFTEMPGNPYDSTETVMCWGNSPTRVVAIRPRPAWIDVRDVLRGDYPLP